MFKHMSKTSCLESNTNYGVWSFKIEHVVKKAFGSMWLEVLEISTYVAFIFIITPYPP